MGFYADLHVHSKYSRATSRDLDLEHMSYWARKKGVTVLGTGDFTHPAWFEELQQKLVPAEAGLFRLSPDIEKEIESWESGPPSLPTRFMLEVEVSTIYKKTCERRGALTRKVHHCIYAPDFDSAQNIRRSLERIGNIASDGRPILGLDSRDLLEITLEGGEGCYLIPAHIWTPWFAALGSKSGFDTIEDCYGDLATEIFAVETGLSSDPAMNRRLSMLDRFTLVSNSDAHSPPKIGREACHFESDMDYFSLRRALETGERYGGTVEFFAEEGKYHMDGHRKCGVCLSPEETRSHDGACPVCGKALTLGVLHRVSELADRSDRAGLEATRNSPYRSLVPLDEVLSEVEQVGPKSKRVRKAYEDIVSKVGSELFILERAPLDELERASSSVLAEAISRMRQGRVLREPGFDGQYGVIRLFQKDELSRKLEATRHFDFGDGLFDRKTAAPTEASRSRPSDVPPGPGSRTRRSLTQAPQPAEASPVSVNLLDALDPRQRVAAETTDGPLVIIAGPGTGKTRTLTHRIAHIISDRDVSPRACLAITFTRRAAGEMAERLDTLLPELGAEVSVLTFHALGLEILREHAARLGYARTPRVAAEAEALSFLGEALGLSARKARRCAEGISRLKRGENSPDDALLRAREDYDAALFRAGFVDFDDLITLPGRLLRENPALAESAGGRYASISIDEFQDIDPGQYALIRQLAPADGNLCVIGDPDQSIYGFRGANPRVFDQFKSDYPSARTVQLDRNYRSTRVIVDASLQMMEPASQIADRELHADAMGLPEVEIHECASDRAEAELVVHRIERLIGGSTFFSIDSGRVESHEGEALAFGDFAVLYRTDSQAEALVEAFHRSGIPFQKRSHGALTSIESVQALLEKMEQAVSDGAEGPLVPDLLEQSASGLRTTHADIDLHVSALRVLAERHRTDPERFFSELSLGIDVDLWDPRAEAVSLLTLHAAKGLEFPVVFIVGVEDGILPLRWGNRTPESAEIDEERRLFFVGMTRAQRELHLTHARKRAWRGKVQAMEPSPFLEDIDRELLKRLREESGKKAPSPYRQLTMFDEVD